MWRMCMQDGGMQVAELIDNPLWYNFAVPDGTQITINLGNTTDSENIPKI